MPKLESDNVLKAVFDALTAKPLDEKRDGLLVVEIDGIKCAVDVANKTVQTGEGREQRWFEVTACDATPKRFLSAAEQMSFREETDSWWTVITTSGRTSFVHAKSRSQALERFAARYPGEIAGADCELARGFDFVDPDSSDWLSEVAPSDAETPAAAPLDEEKPGKPEDFYFGIGSSPDGEYMVLVPKKFWDEHGHLDDRHLEVSGLPPYFGAEDMEATWILPDDKSGEEVAADMEAAGFDRASALEKFLETSEGTPEKEESEEEIDEEEKEDPEDEEEDDDEDSPPPEDEEDEDEDDEDPCAPPEDEVADEAEEVVDYEEKALECTRPLMKIVVEFNVTDTGETVSVMHPNSFDFDYEDVVAIGTVQAVVDQLDESGVKIRQAEKRVTHRDGETRHYELVLTDGCKDAEKKATIIAAQDILGVLAEQLEENGVESYAGPKPKPRPKRTMPKPAMSSPKDFYFGVKAKPKPRVVLCPKMYWDMHSKLYEERLDDLEDFLPVYLDQERSKPMWTLDADCGKDLSEVKTEMISTGFVYNSELDKLL